MKVHPGGLMRELPVALLQVMPYTGSFGPEQFRTTVVMEQRPPSIGRSSEDSQPSRLRWYDKGNDQGRAFNPARPLTRVETSGRKTATRNRGTSAL